MTAAEIDLPTDEGTIAALGFGGSGRPVPVGHSRGGYAVTTVTAAGLIDPAAVCVVDGLGPPGGGTPQPPM